RRRRWDGSPAYAGGWLRVESDGVGGSIRAKPDREVLPLNEDWRARIRNSGAEFLHLQFTDVPGALKSVTIPAVRLDDALAGGVWFDGSSVEGLARTTESDLYLRPDPATFALIPWEPIPAGRLLCDLYLPDGALFVADPRQALKSVLAAADALGFQY